MQVSGTNFSYLQTSTLQNRAQKSQENSDAILQSGADASGAITQSSVSPAEQPDQEQQNSIPVSAEDIASARSQGRPTGTFTADSGQNGNTGTSTDSETAASLRSFTESAADAQRSENISIYGENFKRGAEHTSNLPVSQLNQLDISL
jgi:phage portal protein BeeE